MRVLRQAWLLGKLRPISILIEKGLAVIGSPEKPMRWMQTPISALRGQTPYSRLESEEGRKQVATVLGRIEHGVY
jgi:uncharacterized protein (DUF2384 family)